MQDPSNEERDYYCGECGRWLFATTVPLGTPGYIRTNCAERECKRSQSPKAGAPPKRRVNRRKWIENTRKKRLDARTA